MKAICILRTTAEWDYFTGPMYYSETLTLTGINVKKTYQFKTRCKDDVVISDI